MPLLLRRDSGAAIIRENENGGLLMSIRVDEAQELANDLDRITPPIRGEFSERYRPEARVPKPESTEGGCRVNVLRRPMGAPLNLG